MTIISFSRRQFLGTVLKAGVFVSLPSGLLIRDQESTSILPPYIETVETEKIVQPATIHQPTSLKKNPLKPFKKVISFYNNHTGEFLKNCTFWADNKFCTQALSAINRLCRDHRTGLVKKIDPQLFIFLHQILQKIESNKIINIVSGYRSLTSNQYLCENSSGVARNSYHTKGQALDFHIHGVSNRSLYKAALSLKKGGVGGYSQFIHIDTGRVRRWGTLSA